ncbi:MAG: winged helix-turn-helix domain-containing protein, partial [Gammaproteobacteria bacterium]|nr:winged helix-turn-helix domain-containing protein [Gammaproteobacteria bacterium]
LRICPALGQVATSRGETIRLGPVNMKVLALLLDRAGRVVSRGELFDTVWSNQVVSDDALTRSISDIRAELRQLSGRDDWIETLPKRGYRWTAAVGVAADGARVTAPNAERAGRRALGLAGRGLLYIAALIVMGSAVVWSIDRFAGPNGPVISVFPIAAGSETADAAAAVDRALTERQLAIEGVRILSQSAIDARPANPFPFFYYEFGASWLVEGNLEPMAGKWSLTLSLVDARTGIVELQIREEAVERNPADGPAFVTAFAELERFIAAQLPD